MSEIYTDPPQSRNEAIIKATIDGTEYTAPPQSRMEDLLLELKEAIEHGGGGGGTSDYTQLTNKPQVNGVTLTGNKTSTDLGLMPEYEVDTTPTESSENLITSGGVWSADKNINDKLQGSKTAGSTDGSPFEIPDYGMTESIQMYFKPTQDLHGYDKPWAGGAGKNKLNNIGLTTQTLYGVTFIPQSNGTIHIDGVNDGTADSIYWLIDYSAQITPQEEQILSGLPSEYSGVVYGGNNIGSSSTDVELHQGTSYSIALLVGRGESVNNVTVEPMIRLSTEPDADFEPYSNICPISGQDNATFEWTGKNKCPAYTSTETQYGVTIAGNSEGEISVNGMLDGANLYGFPLNNSISLKAGTYILNGTNPNGARLVLYDSNDNVLADSEGTTTFTLESTTTTVLRMYVYANVQYDEVVRPMIRLFTESSTFKPYTHEERTMNFGNTYYGGFCQFNGQIYSEWDYIASYNGETLSGEWVSDRDEYVAGTTPTIGAEVAYKTTPSYVRVTPPANLNLTDDYPIEYNGYMANIGYQPKNTVLLEAKQYTNQAIAKLGLPQPPTTDGTYHLECSVSSGIPTITWVSNS